MNPPPLDPWTLLNILPGSDSRTIKRAYSQQLKDLDISKDSESFKALHDAYKQALASVKTGEISKQSAPANNQQFQHSPPDYSEQVDYSDDMLAQRIKPLIQHAKTLVYDPDTRLDQWEELLQQEALEDLMLFDAVSLAIARFLIECHQQANNSTEQSPPNPVCKRWLYRYFRWDENTLLPKLFNRNELVLLHQRPQKNRIRPFFTNCLIAVGDVGFFVLFRLIMLTLFFVVQQSGIDSPLNLFFTLQPVTPYSAAVILIITCIALMSSTLLLKGTPGSWLSGFKEVPKDRSPESIRQLTVTLFLRAAFVTGWILLAPVNTLNININDLQGELVGLLILFGGLAVLQFSASTRLHARFS